MVSAPQALLQTVQCDPIANRHGCRGRIKALVSRLGPRADCLSNRGRIRSVIMPRRPTLIGTYAAPAVKGRRPGGLPLPRLSLRSHVLVRRADLLAPHSALVM